MKEMQNQMRREALRAIEQEARPRAGIVDGYDPDHYAVKVRIQPEDILTGWLPLTSPWVGNQWGMYSPPSLGDIVDVHFQQNGPNAAYVVQKFFSTTVQPLPVPSGEFWLVHKSGSLFKLHNDGSVEVSANTNMTLSAPNGIFRVAAQQIQLHASQIFRFDVNGHGQAWTATVVNTYQIGEGSGAANAISPPEIGN